MDGMGWVDEWCISGYASHVEYGSSLNSSRCNGCSTVQYRRNRTGGVTTCYACPAKVDGGVYFPAWLN